MFVSRPPKSRVPLNEIAGRRDVGETVNRDVVIVTICKPTTIKKQSKYQNSTKSNQIKHVTNQVWSIYFFSKAYWKVSSHGYRKLIRAKRVFNRRLKRSYRK